MHSSNFQLHLYGQSCFIHDHPILLIVGYVALSCSRGTLTKSPVVSEDVRFCLLLRCLNVPGYPFCGMP